MEFDRSPLSHERWRDLLREVPRANLLQSWPYAVAACLHDQMMSRRGLIMEAGRMIGFMQIQEIKLGALNFDLGGVNPRRAEGVTTFKAGLGARDAVLTGLFG